VTRPRRPDHAITLDRKVGFQECDPLGVVWHGRYLEWMEAARNELFASFDLDIPQIRALGHRMYVVEAKCRYMAPLTYGDTARLTAWFGEVAPLIRVGYDIHHAGTGRWSARASTTLAVTDGDGGLLSSVPAAMRELLPTLD